MKRNLLHLLIYASFFENSKRILGLGKDNCSTRRETFKIWDSVRFIWIQSINVPASWIINNDDLPLQ